MTSSVRPSRGRSASARTRLRPYSLRSGCKRERDRQSFDRIEDHVGTCVERSQEPLDAELSDNIIGSIDASLDPLRNIYRGRVYVKRFLCACELLESGCECSGIDFRHVISPCS